MCCMVPPSSGVAITTWVSFGLLAKKKTNNNGIEHISDSIVDSTSPSTTPNSDTLIVCAIKNSSKTTPIILHITLQGDDFDANARPLGGGVRGAIMACMRIPVCTH